MYCPALLVRVIKSSSIELGKNTQSGNTAWTSFKTSPIWREKTPNLATLLNVITLQRQRESMIPTGNEAGMKLKLWFWISLNYIEIIEDTSVYIC